LLQVRALIAAMTLTLYPDTSIFQHRGRDELEAMTATGGKLCQ